MKFGLPSNTHTHTQSYSGLRGAVAFSLALARLHGEPALDHPADCRISSEAVLRKTMLTAITFRVLFTVFVQVSGGLCVAVGKQRMLISA